jgi:hypothetical protein
MPLLRIWISSPWRVDLTRFRRRDPEFARTIATVRERNEQNLTAVIVPLAREHGVQNVDDLCQRLVEVTMIFTRGAVMSAVTTSLNCGCSSGTCTP